MATSCCEPCQDCPDGSDELADICASVHRSRQDVPGITDDHLETTDNDGDQVQPELGASEDADQTLLHPCSVWPPVCGQVCIIFVVINIISDIQHYHY